MSMLKNGFPLFSVTSISASFESTLTEDKEQGLFFSLSLKYIHGSQTRELVEEKFLCNEFQSSFNVKSSTS